MDAKKCGYSEFISNLQELSIPLNSVVLPGFVVLYYKQFSDIRCLFMNRLKGNALLHIYIDAFYELLSKQTWSLI